MAVRLPVDEIAYEVMALRDQCRRIQHLLWAVQVGDIFDVPLELILGSGANPPGTGR